ncbi:lanthionine synthetase LanC family protein [Roseivirga sp. BDSF3-8]|uniref:lanthionine synthetase LanC family protein n=1 Tax=Roseivirga sp. BDSF3-8 TaxID=3241598 RepID=UPI003531BD34
MHTDPVQQTLSPDTKVLVLIDHMLVRACDNPSAPSADIRGRNWSNTFSGKCLEANLLLISRYSVESNASDLNKLKENIAEYMDVFKRDRSHNYSLYHGYMGIAYLNLLAFSITSERPFLDNAITISKRCVQSQFHKLEALRPSFNDGLAGCLYVFTLLNRYHSEDWVMSHIDVLSRKLLAFCDLTVDGLIEDGSEALHSFEYGRSGIGWVLNQVGQEYGNTVLVSLGNHIIEAELSRFSAMEKASCLPAPYLDQAYFKAVDPYDQLQLSDEGTNGNTQSMLRGIAYSVHKAEQRENVITPDAIREYADRIATYLTAGDEGNEKLEAGAVYLRLLRLDADRLNKGEIQASVPNDSVFNYNRQALLEILADKWFMTSRQVNEDLGLAEVEEVYKQPVSEVGDRFAEAYEEMLEALGSAANGEKVDPTLHKATIEVAKYRLRKALIKNGLSTSIDYKSLIDKFIGSPSPFVNNELVRNPDIKIVSVGEKVDLGTSFNAGSFQEFWFNYGRYTCVLTPKADGSIEEYVPGVFKIILDSFESPAIVSDVLDKLTGFFLSQNEEIINGLMFFTESQDIDDLKNNLRFAVENGVYELIMEGILLVR